MGFKEYQFCVKMGKGPEAATIHYTIQGDHEKVHLISEMANLRSKL